MPISDNAQPTVIEVTSSFPEFVSASKNISLFHLLILEIEPILESCDLSSHTHFWAYPPQNFSRICTKNQAISSIYCGVLVNLKILQSDWLGEFWSVSQEPNFSRIWNLCRNISNDINFYYGTNLEKNEKTKFFNKFKKAYFRPISRQFWGKKILFQNILLCHAQLHMDFWHYAKI